MTGDIDKLLAELERMATPPALERVRALVAALLDAHAAGLGRVTSLLEMRGEAGHAILKELVRDRDVESLLLLHGLHPVELAARVDTALAGLTTALHARGVQAVVLTAANGRVAVRIDALAGGVPQGSARQLVEHALGEAAPDADVEITLGFDDAATFVPVARLGARP
jgi:hypothetical protein